MRDWGPLGEIIALAYAVAGAFAVLWLVGVFWLALQQVRTLWPLFGLLLAVAASIYLARHRRSG